MSGRLTAQDSAEPHTPACNPVNRYLEGEMRERRSTIMLLTCFAVKADADSIKNDLRHAFSPSDRSSSTRACRHVPASLFVRGTPSHQLTVIGVLA